MSATLAHEPNKLPAGILALAVHGAFFSLLYFGFSWQTLQPEAMRVELWQSLPEEVAAPPVETPPVEHKVEKVEPPPPPQKIIEPDIALPDKKKPRPVEKVKPKRAETKPVETKSLTKIADQQVAREQARVAEQAAREQAEQVTRDARNRAAKDAAINSVVGEYKGKIERKIRKAVRNPPGVADDAHAEFLVTLLPDGSVLKAELKKSSGNAAYDDAVEHAIWKSVPLPLPPDVALFSEFREILMTFKPEKKPTE